MLSPRADRLACTHANTHGADSVFLNMQILTEVKRCKQDSVWTCLISDNQAFFYTFGGRSCGRVLGAPIPSDDRSGTRTLVWTIRNVVMVTNEIFAKWPSIDLNDLAG